MLIIREVNKDYKPMIEEPRTWILNVIYLTVQIYQPQAENLIYRYREKE